MKKIFQMHLSEDTLSRLANTGNPAFIRDYRKCNGRFRVHYIGSTGRNVHVEKTHNPEAYWVVSLENGKFVDDIDIALDEKLFEI